MPVKLFTTFNCGWSFQILNGLQPTSSWFYTNSSILNKNGIPTMWQFLYES